MGARVKKGYVDTEFGQVHYYAAGESGPLLFLFHETALAASEFLKVLPILGEKCRAVALDTPGYGMSDPPPEPLDMAAFSARLWRAIECFGGGPCIVAGAHTGSSFALELATQQLAPRVTHVVLSGLALLTPQEVAGFRKIIGSPELDPEGDFLVEEWEKRRQRWGHHTPLEDILWGTAEQLMVFQRFHWAFEAVFSHDAELALQKLDCPTLFLIGEHDSLVKSDQRAASLVADAQLKILPGIGGRLPYFEPATYAQEVLRFVDLD